jgi:hypothetical protein
MDFVVDIDGTVSDCNHRLHWLNVQPKNHKAFFAGMVLDTPIVPVIAVVKALADSGHRIVFCSGRPDTYKTETRDWIDRFIGVSGYDLYMRRGGDHRDDSIVKEELLRQMRLVGIYPAMVFDDRQRIVDMWRKNGIICAQLSPGNF